MLPALPYSNELVFALETAQIVARDYRHHVYSSEHLLEALFSDEVGLIQQLENWGLDVPFIKEWAEIRLSNFPKAMQTSSEPPPGPKVKKLLEVADVIRLKLAENQISPLAAMAALVRPEVAFSADQLKSLPITENELLSFKVKSGNVELDNVMDELSAFTSGKGGSKEKGGVKNLFKYCVDKTALAKEGKIDPIIGREGEIRMMGEILSRRTKPNVMIVGEPGVGKTALVEGFALKIINGEVPGRLKKASVLGLDVGSLVAGASYKGELEDRLKKIIKEIKLMDNAILFIDEIHMLLGDKGPTGSGAANLLKPELARGEITVIGATTSDEYRKYIEKDEAFARRFEVLRVKEPDAETAFRMLKAILPKYEEHHSLQMVDSSIEEAVKLAQRYFKERSLPDTAVDLMDKTMAAIRLMSEGSTEVIEALHSELTQLYEEKNEEANAFYRELKWFEGQMKQRLSPILVNQVQEEDGEKNQKEDPGTLHSSLKEKLDQINELAQIKVEKVEPHHVAAIVSHSTGIPFGKIQTKEREKLLNMEAALQERVIGQNFAIQMIADAVQIARSGIKEPGKPVGSFFFLGPTGTGKTELAKTLANFLFNDERALIRFDMSEFKDRHSGAGLLGSPPGYVGFEEGGPLVNKIRQQPYAVVLFDEIEKAHAGIFDIFLQILDEGKVSDMLGKEGDFSNAIILFTSNIGSRHIVDQFEQEQKLPEENDLREIMMNHFRPEFLGRVGSVVPFAPITEEIILGILNIHLKKLKKLTEAQGIRLSLSEEAKKHIAISGFNPEFGARPLIGEIRRQLSRPLSRMMIKGEAKAGDLLHIDLNDQNELTWNVK